MIFVMEVYPLKETDDNFLLKTLATSLATDVRGPRFKYSFLHSELYDLEESYQSFLNWSFCFFLILVS